MRLVAATGLSMVLVVGSAALAGADITVKWGQQSTRFEASASGAANLLALMELASKDDATPRVPAQQPFDSEKYQRRLSDAIAAFVTLRPFSGDDDAYAKRNAELGNLDSEFDSLSFLHPADPIPHYYRGLISIERGLDRESAISHLEKARSLGDHDRRIWRLLVVLYDEDQPAQAVERARSGIREYPDDAFLRGHEVMTLASLQRVDEAIRACQALVDRTGDDDDRVLLAALFPAERDADAVSILEDVRKRRPTDKAVLSLLLQIDRRRGRDREAAELETQLRAAYPDDPDVRKLSSH